jgi:hypothetical protein
VVHLHGAEGRERGGREDERGREGGGRKRERERGRAEGGRE